jgi:hypothetical protein
MPTLLIAETVLEISGLELATGTDETKLYEFAKKPVVAVDSINAFSELGQIDFWIMNTGNKNTKVRIVVGENDETVQVQAIGSYVDRPIISSGDIEDKLELKNEYIQKDVDVTWYLAKMNAFIPSTDKYITVKARGNLLFELGDKVQINSTRYAISFTGMLIAASYSYGGGLSAEYIFLNLATLGV